MSRQKDPGEHNKLQVPLSVDAEVGDIFASFPRNLMQFRLLVESSLLNSGLCREPSPIVDSSIVDLSKALNSLLRPRPIVDLSKASNSLLRPRPIRPESIKPGPSTRPSSLDEEKTEPSDPPGYEVATTIIKIKKILEEYVKKANRRILCNKELTCEKIKNAMGLINVIDRGEKGVKKDFAFVLSKLKISINWNLNVESKSKKNYFFRSVKEEQPTTENQMISSSYHKALKQCEELIPEKYRKKVVAEISESKVNLMQ